MPRFVILSHDWPSPHFDLMLEAGAVLLTWRLKEAPVAQSIQVAEQISDHRLDYLEFEGPISRNRGQVTCWDRGTFEWHAKTDEQYSIEFCGIKLTGPATWDQPMQRWNFGTI